MSYSLSPHSMQIRRRHPNPSVSMLNFRYEVAVPDAEPRHILEKIVWQKEIEVEKSRERFPLKDLQRQVQALKPPLDFREALIQGKTKPALIAEVKKASPSKGIIREDFDPVAIAQAYQKGGASAISVLTDEKFFSGSWENLRQIRAAVDIPLLCKEFIIYPYQIYQARAHGADAVLLIAAILSDQDLQYFIKIAKALGMSPLIEVHTFPEIDRVLALEGVTLIGINNRNLEDFTVDLQTTYQILSARGQVLQDRGIQVVSESGLHTATDLCDVASAGATAVLIGEFLVKQPDPALGIAALFPA